MNDTNDQPGEHPVDDELEERKHILVVGSDNFDLTAVFAQPLVHWWLNAGRPYTTLVVEDTALGEQVMAVWGSDKFPIERHPAPSDSRRNELVRRRLMTTGVSHAFIFDVNGEHDSWITDLDYLGIPWTRVSITRSA